MTLFNWSQTAASNATADATINWQENQAPGTVNDSARAMMAAVAKFRDDLSGKLNTGGTSTAYTVTTNQVFTSLSDGIQVAVRLHATNGAAPTFSPDTLTAKEIQLQAGTSLAGGELLIGTIVLLTYDSGDDVWIVSGGALSGQQVPAGTVVWTARSTAPDGWVISDGTAYNSVTDTSFAALYSAIGNTYGGADGTDFQVPNIPGRVIAGKEAAATLLTSAISGVDGATLGATGGTQSKTIAQANLPDVNFTVTDPGHNHVVPGIRTDFTIVGGDVANQGPQTGSSITVNSSTTGISVNSGGSGTALAVVQPTIILLPIIKK